MTDVITATPAKRGRPREFVRIPVTVGEAAMTTFIKKGNSLVKMNPKGAVNAWNFAIMIAEAMGDEDTAAEYRALVREHEETVEREANAQLAATLGEPAAVNFAA